VDSIGRKGRKRAAERVTARAAGKRAAMAAQQVVIYYRKVP